jgi:hypothetical protein
MADGVTMDRTRTSAVAEATVQTSRTRTIDDLVEEAGHLRNVTRILGEDLADTTRQVGALHHHAFAAQLNTSARQLAKRSAQELLADLADGGFAWRDIARLVGVSVPAVRRWRQGELPTGQNLLTIARLVGFVAILRDDHLVTSVASWLEMPLVYGSSVTGIDLAAAGRYEDLLDLAANHERSAQSVLDRWQPDWQSRYGSEFEIFTAPDGEAGIRLAAPAAE